MFNYILAGNRFKFINLIHLGQDKISSCPIFFWSQYRNCVYIRYGILKSSIRALPLNSVDIAHMG